MQSILKYTAIIICCGTAIVFLFKLQSCWKAGAIGPQSLDVPQDSSFQPMVHQNYKPPSLPFSKGKLPAKLPQGVGERDVKRVVSVTVKDVKGSRTIDIVETKTGAIYVPKDSVVVSAVVTNIVPPLFTFQLRYGLGVTVGDGGGSPVIRLMPAATASLMEWDGWLQAPIVSADLDGVGLGIQCKLYHDIYAGGLWQRKFEGGSQGKLVFDYAF